MFKGRIAHGFLTVSFVSSVLGTKMPGPGAVYVSQTVRFLAPVHSGDTVVSRATVIGLLPEKRRVTLDTRCIVRDKVVLEGEAVVFIPPR
jgi:3-hydroxybutyryl-CoA dehydratase